MRVAELHRDLHGKVEPSLLMHMQRQQEEIAELKMQMKSVAQLLNQIVDALNQLRSVNIQLNSRLKKRATRDPDDFEIQSVIPDQDKN